MIETILNKNKVSVIQFLHANAYTPGCYLQMFLSFTDYKIIMPEQRPLWPDSKPGIMKSWDILVDDLIQYMDDAQRKNVVGIGHSMGGIVSWLAAIRRPDLFSKLILIDPVIFPDKAARSLRMVPMFFKKRYIPIVKTASRRRDTWNNRDEAKKYFKSKKVFQRFQNEAFEDFLKYGLQENESGVSLAYPRAWEARVYAHPPFIWSKMKKTPCEITIVRAEYSDVISKDRWEKIKNEIPKGHFVDANGAGHLVPFEQPDLCAKIVREVL